MYNITNLAKITPDDRRLTEEVLKFYVKKELNIDLIGYKNPAYWTGFNDYNNFSTSLRKSGRSYLIKVDKVYSTLKSCNTDLIYFKTLAPKLLSLLNNRKYGFVKILTFKPKPPEDSSTSENVVPVS
jgi:hypothetical protein